MSSRKWSNVTRSGKLHYNAEQLAVAKAASALEYARSQGYPLEGHGNRWTMKGHDSMVFLSDGRWYWNSRGLNGRALDFVVGYEGRSLPEAVLILNGVDLSAPQIAPIAVPNYESPQLQPERKKLMLPERSPDMRRSFSYLAITRGIDYDIIWGLVQQGRIFETVNQKADGGVYHNVTFAGLDDLGVIRSASLRGCAVQSTFKAEVPGSNKAYPFVIPGHEGTETLYVFESAIDAMSHATLCKLLGEPWEKSVRVALGGGNTIAPITRLLQSKPTIRNVVFGLDMDEAGQRMTALCMDHLQKAGAAIDHMDVLSVPYGKDWNAYLQRWRRVVEQHAELPTTEYERADMKSCCGRIHYLENDGSVSASVAYCTPAVFHRVICRLRNEGVPFVAETPQQLRMLERRAQRRRTREEKQVER